MLRISLLTLSFALITAGLALGGTGGSEDSGSKGRLIPDLSGMQQIRQNGVDYIVMDDMLLPEATIKGAESLPLKRWPGGVLPIVFNANVNTNNQFLFFQACQWWSVVANVTCIAQTTQPNSIEVIADNVNQSNIGMVGGRQPLRVFDWTTSGIIAHEIGHALGLVHEHQRLDRDYAVKINFQNIQPGKENNFVVLSSETRSNYDFESIMHYPTTAFSRNGQPTIQAIDPGNDNLMGNLTRLSDRDIVTVMRMYGENMGTAPSRVVLNAINNRLVLAYSDAWDHGYRVRVAAGPTVERFVIITICETEWYFPRVTSQSISPGSRVRFDAVVDLKTIEDSVFYFRPPPPGKQCP